jgi:hypothetical protein
MHTKFIDDLLKSFSCHLDGLQIRKYRAQLKRGKRNYGNYGKIGLALKNEEHWKLWKDWMSTTNEEHTC